jgi:hypothetical protein
VEAALMSGRWGAEPAGRNSGAFFFVGMLVGSACGLVVGSALGFELRPERLRALRKVWRRVLGERDDEPRFDLMV